jgi:hypothetical protein
MQKIGNPIASFFDARGALLDGGKITLGVPSGDPTNNPIVAYWDSALTIVAAQPLRTIGGRIVNGVTPAHVFVAEDDYSMRIIDSDDSLVDYSPSVFIAGIQYQPLDADLTLIAQLATSIFGRNLLTLANQAALQAAVGYAPFTGGVVTSNITRSGAGVTPYYSDPAMTGGRIYVTTAGAADPTSQPGDLWFTY